ncbi:MAG: tRNA-(ms[2]io[6]A)-hydroxylase, partial [Myxococcales bacterium]|nr:tRNA-(ms[2]io[6]A)-hydroxylase [Myxococcales bacterium]
VLGELDRLGIAFERQRPGPYGGKLRQVVRDKEPARLLDTLLCCAVIEARSCERLQLLARELADPSLRELYERLLASEARHHGVYVELARVVAPDERALRTRLEAVCRHEARTVAAAPDLPRLHAGAGFVRL